MGEKYKTVRIIVTLAIIGLCVSFFVSNFRGYTSSDNDRLFAHAEAGEIQWVNIYVDEGTIEYKVTGQGGIQVTEQKTLASHLKYQLNELGVKRVYIRNKPFYKENNQSGFVILGVSLFVIAIFLLACIYFVRQIKLQI